MSSDLCVNRVMEEQIALLLKKKKKGKKKKVCDSSGDKTERDYTYIELLDRIFMIIQKRNSNTNHEYKNKNRLPPPEILRIGTKKVMWSNFLETCKLLRRNQDHVMSFFMVELATQGSLDANKHLVIKGRYSQKQIESLLKKYIVEYVTCSLCKSLDTSLTRDSVSRLYFITCSNCGAKRSVTSIRSGFHATSRSDRRAKKLNKM